MASDLSATADESGRMEIPADFSGWVRIPYAGLVDDSGEPLKDTLSFDRINILPTELGGPYGELSVGSFMIVNHSLLDLPTMRVDAAAEIKLTGNNYYSALMPELSEVLACGNVARTVTVSSENCDFFKGGSLYTVSPKNSSAISMGAEDGVEVAFREELNITGKNGLLMYVALPDTANTVRIGGAFALSAGKPVYVLGAGNDADWEKQKVAIGGAISLPAGFKGYIRFPFTSMKQQPTDDIKKFIVSFTAVGGKYGNPKFGNIMLIDEAQYDLYDVLISGTTIPQTLYSPTYLVGLLVLGNFTVLNNTADANHVLSVMETGNTLTPDIENGYAAKISAPVQDVRITTETLPCVHYTPSQNYTAKIKSSGGVMFYVQNDSEQENALFFQVYGDVYATTLRASEYSVLEKDNAYWTKHASNGNGDITLPAGFEGWIRVPYASLKSPNGALLNEEVKYFNFLFKNVGGEYGTPTVGDIIILNNDGDFGQLSLEGMSAKVSLFGSGKPTEYGRNDVAIWKSVTDPLCGYRLNDAVSLTATTDIEAKNQTTSTFTETVSDNQTPFDAKAVAFDSTNRVVNQNDTPRFSGVMPFVMNGAKGIVVAVDLPAAESGTNDFYFQVSTASGNWLTVKYKYLLPVIRAGETDWNYVEVVNQRVQLANDPDKPNTGFKGYIFFPNDYLATYKDPNGVYKTLREDDTIVNMAFGFGEYGGKAGNACVKGIFVSENGVLSHDGAFVDGNTVCRNIFTGETVSADSVKYTVFDVPSKSGAMLIDLPVPTGGSQTAYVENVTSRSAEVIIDKYPGANRYRCDLYIMKSLPGQFGYTYYEYVSSTWTDSQHVKLDGLTTGIYYTLVVSAFRNDTGLYIYPLCSIFTESQVVGDMLIAQVDPYVYEWDVGGKQNDEEYEEIVEEYEEIIEDGEEIIEPEEDPDETEEEEEILPTAKRRKKIVRRRRKAKDMSWLWILICICAVVLIGIILFIIFKKKKKREEEANE